MVNDNAPQLRVLSTNTCPNARRRPLADMSSCEPEALTTWGYCNECWTRGLVPASWATQVDQEIDRITGTVSR